VDGKVRDRLDLRAGMSEEALKEAVFASAKVRQAIGGKSIGRVIVVADKLVNVVTGR
jgi:leucyl-tRNA synthetase